MALLFIDNPTHYTPLQARLKWDSGYATPGTQHVISSTNGRRAGQASHRFSGSGTVTSEGLVKAYPTTSAVILGMAVRRAIIGGNSFYRLFEISNAGVRHARLSFNAQTGLLRLDRQLFGGATTIATSGYFLPLDEYVYLEARIVINAGASGSWEIRINGVNVFSGTGTTHSDSTVVTTSDAVTIGFDNVSSFLGGALDVCDLYVLDTAGAINNTFLGDVRVDVLTPFAPGDSSQFTGSDGNSVDNHLLVDDATPNDDTDYVESTTVGHRDLYNMTNLGFTPLSIMGVNVVQFARKTDAGTRQIRSVLSSGVTVATGPVKGLGTDYLFFQDLFSVDPNTSAAWTAAAIDALQAGFEVVT